ncbi:MAG: hypothetical protein IT298_03755 [Chloroflexi bacterium]|jgi:hypothetical protein|nr:MAG: hypothetical protein UZ13_01229 [Chloroflexi bacterium OLB13]MBC6957563.1 hypothetical protein [Chloroflexota bacterium]MBV6434997.1 hypothetical protein [Anaerolineae bacterium]MDL1914750.1 hypothetical protein [Anaerolineae bacterium CFX4]OQY81451.1 MAG: hypothetical protein B6D42_11220 [Anaerolineae bacterium UTCFX5]
MDLQTALELLYTDESLAADLDDQTAGPFLKWAESQLPAVLSRADAQSADGEDSFTAFRRLLKSMTRYVAASIAGDSEMAAQRADQLRTMASSLALSAPVEAMIQSAAADGPTLIAQLAAAPPAAETPAAPPTDALVEPLAAAYTPPDAPTPQPEGQNPPSAQQVAEAFASHTQPESPAQGTEGSPPASTPDEPESPRNLFDMLRRAFDDARAAQSPDDKE